MNLQKVSLQTDIYKNNNEKKGIVIQLSEKIKAVLRKNNYIPNLFL